MAEQFQPREKSGPAFSAITITPSNVTPLPYICRGIYVGGGGDLTVKVGQDESSVTFIGVPAGTLLPIQAAHVLATGTTATDLVGLL